MKQNIPSTVDCEIDSMPLTNITYHWTLWIDTMENIDNLVKSSKNYSISISNNSKLDVLKVMNDFQINQNAPTVTTLDNSKSNLYSVLLLQCQAQNSIGRQKNPCLYMLHIYPGIYFYFSF